MKRTERQNKAERKTEKRKMSMDNGAHLTDVTLNILPSIQTSSDLASPLPDVEYNDSGGDSDSDDSYTDETLIIDDPGKRLAWCRKHRGKARHQEELALREAALRSQHEDKERNRIERKEVDAIRRLRQTDPMKCERQMHENNLRLSGCTQKQIDAARNRRPLTEEEMEASGRRWKAVLGLSDWWFLQTDVDGPADTLDSESGGLSESRVQYHPFNPRKLTNGIARHTHSGSTTKQGKSVDIRGTRFRRTTLAPVEALMPDH